MNDETNPALRIRVVVADDNADVVETLCLYLGVQADIERVVGAHDGASLLRAIREIRPEVALVDLTMPGEPTPLEAIRTAADDVPETRAIAYSGYDDGETVEAALTAGAWGFVSKRADPRRVLAAVRAIAAGEAVVDDAGTA